MEITTKALNNTTKEHKVFVDGKETRYVIANAFPGNDATRGYIPYFVKADGEQVCLGKPGTMAQARRVIGKRVMAIKAKREA